MAADEIELFRREMVERGDARASDASTMRPCCARS